MQSDRHGDRFRDSDRFRHSELAYCCVQIYEDTYLLTWTEALLSPATAFCECFGQSLSTWLHSQASCGHFVTHLAHCPDWILSLASHAHASP